MISAIYLIILTITLASLHMIAPDHWVPISILSSRRKYSTGRTSSLSLSIGIIHGVVSVILSLLVAFAGVLLIGNATSRILAAILLIIVAIYMLVNAIKEKESERSIENTSVIVSILPDPAFLPFALLAITFGNTFLALICLIFVVSSGLALMIVVLLVRISIFRKLEKLKPTTVDAIVIAILILTALFIFLS